VTLKIEQSGGDVLATAFALNTLTISLANTTASNNNVAAIQALIYAMGVVDTYDMSELTFSGIDWDNKQTGATLTTPTSILSESIPFNINDQLLPGIEAKIVFKTGDLAGYEFQIKRYDDTLIYFQVRQ
jgi:hypothetical protein